MIGKMNVLVQKLRWALDPSRWMIRLLGLSKFEENQKEPGLILIQMDGLSHTHFHHAIRRGYLPFLKKLKMKEGYRDFHHYAGVPSCTPAIQAELFYGIKQAVPAFKFVDHKTGEIACFYESHTACLIEGRLEKQKKGLLTGGSSYSNIFSAGAKENAHFCVASVGWHAFFHAMNPYSLTVLILFNLFTLLRSLFYITLEFILAVFDSFRGTLLGFGFREEFMFILPRLLITVGLRELTTLGVKLDIARGLPVIHANFFGYDDQAHRRGPSSRFAYWSLPGIDACIKRIWEAAQNSVIRDYDVWIYSDHGQEEAIPYATENGKKIEDAIADVFHGMLPDENFEIQGESNGKRKMGCREANSFFQKPSVPISAPPLFDKKIVVTAQGPLGFIYPHRSFNAEEREKCAHALIGQAHIPLVITRTDENEVYGFTREGKFLLPDEAGRILGENHPYLEEVGEELKTLGRHLDTGAFIISGWKKNSKSISFPMEYGSHAGPGPQEMDGFALLPKHLRVPLLRGKYLRPSVLRELALDYLQGSEKILYETDPLRVSRRHLRLMTYNVHSCIGMDGKLSPDRIARVIARHDPDVIALQELDVGRLRTNGMDQAKIIAELLDMNYHFHPVRMIEEELYGNAILSRTPLKIIDAGSLPRAFDNFCFEPRGALWAEIEYLDTRIQLINTHLSFWAHEQKKQAESLCGPHWLSNPACDGNVILCGDFNAFPGSKVCQSIQKHLQDVQQKLDSHKPLNTWFGHFPVGRIDHIFVNQKIKVIKVEVPSSRLEKMASDHLPLIAELRIPANYKTSTV